MPGTSPVPAPERPADRPTAPQDDYSWGDLTITTDDIPEF